MRYAVRYFEPALSRVVDEEVDADSEAELRARLRQNKCTVLALHAAAGASIAVSSGRAAFDVAWWCRELRTLLKAGMTVVEAIETLHAQANSGRRAEVHARLLRSLRQGQSLSNAMRSCGDAFSDVLVASVAASERTSTLVEALDDYLRYDEMLRRLRKQAVSAAIYPLVVVALGALISLFLLFYVVPRFSRMYTDVSRELSGATQAVLWLSAVMRERSGVVLGALAGVAGGAAWAWRRGWVAAAAAALAASVPSLQRQLDEYKYAKLYQSLALMFRGGYTLDEALAVCEGLRLGGRFTPALAGARGQLARGRSVSASFSEAGLTDTVSQRLLAVGERTGGFDAVLQTVADRHADAFATFVERATRIIEPVLLLVVALVVGGIVVMMYMPIFDIANSVR